MAEYGEWNRKGATLSDVTAKSEYGVDRNFIIKGINAGTLEYREGAIWGNPYIRVLRSQLEKFIADEHGAEYLARIKAKGEMRKINKEISDLKNQLQALELRKTELDELMHSEENLEELTKVHDRPSRGKKKSTPRNSRKRKA
jgi:hypothetical protein